MSSAGFALIILRVFAGGGKRITASLIVDFHMIGAEKKMTGIAIREPNITKLMSFEFDASMKQENRIKGS